MKLCVKLQVALAHGTTLRVSRHVAVLGMTTVLQAQVHLAQAGVQVLAQVAGTVALAQAIAQVHQAGINYVFC